MRILVSGAHGFIGSHLCERLLAGGHAVRALVSPWGVIGNLRTVQTHPNAEIVRADITDPESLRGICDDVDAVIHSAARLADWGPPQPLMETNAGGTRNLLDAATASGTRRFVLVSSVAVHRFRGFRNADPERLPRDNGTMPYARSKIAAEDLVLAWPGEGVVVRPGLWPFGPRDPQTRRVAAALKGGRLPLLGDGGRVLNTAYVGNLTLGLELAAVTPKQGGRVFVIADDGAPTWREALAEFARLIGARPPRLRLPGELVLPVATGVEALWRTFAPKAEPPLTRYRATLMLRDVHFSLIAAERHLGYRPELSWRAGMAVTVSQDPLLRPDGEARVS
ncbi:MAG: NAD-dependent epimerase/dehydratase family protein [Trueperaceae bacterium]